MEPVEIGMLLKSNAYPGRGIIIGRTPDSRKAVIAYFIMGRSANSRNRVFESFGSGIRTRAYDPSLLTDPSLIIYSPVRVEGDAHIVTNGDQTDTICEYLRAGRTFEDALRTRTFEPDAPNFTPRISGIVKAKGGTMEAKLSIIKSMDRLGSAPERHFFEYPLLAAGEGRFVHTYKSDGNPLPSFEGEPVRIRIPGGVDIFPRIVWEALDCENRISLFVREIDIESGRYSDMIINKHV